jgi:hypothetical protein
MTGARTRTVARRIHGGILRRGSPLLHDYSRASCYPARWSFDVRDHPVRPPVGAVLRNDDFWFIPAVPTLRKLRFAADSSLEGAGFEPSVPPCGTTFFRDRPGNRARTNRLGSQNRILTIDKGQVYYAPCQAGPGNDINAGSLGFLKAPTRGPASLVVILALTRPVPGDGRPAGRRYA